MPIAAPAGGVRGGGARRSPTAAADEISRQKPAASNALGELEAAGAQLDPGGEEAIINENEGIPAAARGRNPGAGGGDGLFTAPMSTPLAAGRQPRSASTYLVLIARWKQANPRSHVLLDIANTHDVFERVAPCSAPTSVSSRGPTATRASRSASGAAMRSSWSPPLATRWWNVRAGCARQLNPCHLGPARIPLW